MTPMRRLRLVVAVLIAHLEAIAAQSGDGSGASGGSGGARGGGGDGGQQPPPQPINVTLSGTLSLTGNSYVEESHEALRGLQLGLSLQYLQSLLPSNSPHLQEAEEINVKLDIRDDQGDPVLCQSLYEEMLHTFWEQEYGYQIFLGPISEALSQVAANITTWNNQLLMLPFTSLPVLQYAQTSPASVFSLEVPAAELLKMPLFQVAQGGAKTLAVWSALDPFFVQMCDGAVTEALRLGMEVVFQRDNTSNLFVLEQTRQMTATRPDVLVVCQEYQASIELMVTLDFIHFQPNAFIIWDSANQLFYDPLLVSNAVDIIGADHWSSRFETCGGEECATPTRAQFFESYQSLYNTPPSVYAGQAAAAAVAVTYLVQNIFSESVLEVGTEWDKMNTLSTELRNENVPKGSFYHPLIFNNQGFLHAASVEVTQLAVQNFSAQGRRLQPGGAPGGAPASGPAGNGSNASGTPPEPAAPPVLIAPVSAQQLSAFTTLQVVLRGVFAYQRGTTINAASYDSKSEIAYPRLLEEKREVLEYPCDLGFEVRTEKLWAMINSERQNVTGGPISPCEPCSRGYFRSAVGSSCASCPDGTQATQEAQSECSDCLQGTLCLPDSPDRVVAPGFYEAYGLLLPCQVEGRCLGENRCLGNSAGVMCSQCSTGYASDPERATAQADPCRACDAEWAVAIPRLVFEISMYLVLYVLLLLAHWSSCVSLMSTSCFILRAAVNHMQFLAITLTATTAEFIANNLSNTNGYFVWIVTLILDPVKTFPVECMSSTWKKHQVKALLGLCIIPAVVLTVVSLSVFWEFIFGPLLLVVCPKTGGEDEDDEEEDGESTSSGPRHHMSFKRKGKSVHHSASLGVLSGSPSIGRCVSRIAESSLIWCHLLLPMAIFNLLDVLRCQDPKDQAVAVVDYPRPIQVHLDDFGVQCGQGDHTLWTILAISGIVLYGMGIPASMAGLIQGLFSHESWKSHRAFGYIIDGSSSDYLYIQIIIMFIMIIALALANMHFIPTIFRCTWLMSLYAAYSSTICHVVPFDARDNSVLLWLELLSMLGQLVLLTGYILKSGLVPLLNDAPGALVEVPWLLMHILFFLVVLKQLVKNVVLKRIQYCPSVKDLTLPEQFLYDFLGLEKDKVILDVATGTLDLTGLSASSRKTMQVALTVALERYFKASSEGLVPWTEVCDPAQIDDAEPERDVLDPARPGQLHAGFLSAAIYESLVEVEASRQLRWQASKRRRGLLSQFFKADAREPKMDMESIEGDFTHGGQNKRGKVEMEVKQKSELTGTAEEIYMAMTLLLKSVLKGQVDLYDLQQKHQSHRHAAQGDEERSIQDILEEVSTKQGEFEEEDLSQEGSEIFEVPEPAAVDDDTDQPLPALLRIRTEVPRPDDHPNLALARTLGIRHVSNVQDKLSTMQQMHDKKYHETIELRAEIQELHRHLAEAEAKYAQMQREADNTVASSPRSERSQRGASKDSSKEEKNVSTPRSPRRVHNFGKGVSEDYVTQETGERRSMKYPYEKWSSTKRTWHANKKQRQAASNARLAPNLKASTVEVADTSFWSKAAT